MIHPVTIFDCDDDGRPGFECIDRLEQQGPGTKVVAAGQPGGGCAGFAKQLIDDPEFEVGLRLDSVRAHYARVLEPVEQMLRRVVFPIPGGPWTIPNPARPLCADS